jgi:thiol-disulfide isomerase/thioredoxin
VFDKISALISFINDIFIKTDRQAQPKNSSTSLCNNIKEDIMRVFLFLLLTTVLFFHGNYNTGSGLQVGQIPPELSYYSLSENMTVTYRKSDFKNGVLIIDFWATWCSPCIESIPHLNKLVDKFKGDNVKFISITYEPESLAEKFLTDYPMKSDVGIDNDFEIFRSYNAWAIPNIVMINTEGKFAGRIHPNYLTTEVIEVLLQGGIPEVKNTPEDAFDPVEAEKNFRLHLEKQKMEMLQKDEMMDQEMNKR